MNGLHSWRAMLFTAALLASLAGCGSENDTAPAAQEEKGIQLTASTEGIQFHLQVSDGLGVQLSEGITLLSGRFNMTATGPMALVVERETVEVDKGALTISGRDYGSLEMGCTVEISRDGVFVGGERRGPFPPEPKKLSLLEAEEAVRKHIFSKKPGMNPSAAFPLKELTRDEIWDRLSLQVFQVTGGISQYSTYLVKKGRVELLGTGLGGFGVVSMCVTDLDRSGKPELCYAYSWGSGIHRSHVAVYLEEGLEPGLLVADLAFRDGDLVLKKVDDQHVVVEEAAFARDGESFIGKRRIGKIVLEGQEDLRKLILVPDEGLPGEITGRFQR